MSIESFIKENVNILKNIGPEDFFDRFTNDVFEMGIELESKHGEKSLQFISIAREDLVFFCCLHSINSITYFIGEKTKMIVRLSKK